MIDLVSNHSLLRVHYSKKLYIQQTHSEMPDLPTSVTTPVKFSFDNGKILTQKPAPSGDL